MRKKIIIWLRKNIKEAKAKGVVIGLSGGLDSCVAAALAVEALGKKRVLGLFLPCRSQKQDLADAKIFARRFGIKAKIIDLSDSYDALLKVLPPADRMTQANLRPRLRMISLYYFARKLNYLVCGTSNKSELMSGYFTKFGDGASDLLPLGDLLKKEVRKLGEELKIPAAILEKPPTAGLWPGQTDEGDLGITYDELDDILARRESGEKQVLPAGKVKRVEKLIEISEHKRQKAAVCCV